MDKAFKVTWGKNGHVIFVAFCISEHGIFLAGDASF